MISILYTNLDNELSFEIQLYSSRFFLKVFEERTKIRKMYFIYMIFHFIQKKNHDFRYNVKKQSSEWAGLGHRKEAHGLSSDFTARPMGGCYNLAQLMGFRLKTDLPMGHPKPGWVELGQVKSSPFRALVCNVLSLLPFVLDTHFCSLNWARTEMADLRFEHVF
mgnify:CR=1 FL=1